MFKFLLVLSVSILMTSFLCLSILYVGQLNPFEAILLFPFAILGALLVIDAV